MRNLLMLVGLLVVAWLGFSKLEADRPAASSLAAPVAETARRPVGRPFSRPFAPAPVATAPATAASTAAPTAAPFHCDGRTRCPQMRSCAEATYFIQHCPGTTMDGDGDGVPCEQQWCQ